MITSPSTISAPYSHSPASLNAFNIERPQGHVYDLPWITRAVKHQVNITLEAFLDTLLPEFSQASTDSDRYIADTIREYNSSDPKISFHCLFDIFTVNATPVHLDEVQLGDSKVPTPVRAITEFDLKGKNTRFNGTYYASEGRFKNVWHYLAKRASDALSTGLPRHHIFGVYVKKDYAYFLYYDHSIVLVSNPMNWVKDPHKFWRIIYTMSNVGLDRMGFADEFFALPDVGPLHLNGLRLEFIDVVHTSEHVIGESTSMVHARILADPPYKDQLVTVRFNFIPRDKGWKYEAEVVSDLCKRESSVSRRLPVVVTHKVYPSSEMEERIRLLLGDTYVPRELRLTVYAGTLYPVTTLTDDFQILRVLRDVMAVRRKLSSNLSYFHRALNPSNIVFRWVGNNIQGVLIGYEMSAHLKEILAESVPSCLQSVESSPFLSLDYLNNYEGWSIEGNWARYELESVYYVLFFIVSHYEGGKRIAGIQPPFDTWFSDDQKRIAASKMENMLAETPQFTPTSSLAKLEPRVRSLHTTFHGAYKERAESGVTTMIGHCVRYEMIFACLFWDLLKQEGQLLG